MPFKTCLAVIALGCVPLVSLAADPELKLPAFEHMRETATDSVNVTLGSVPLGIAALALEGDTDPQSVEIRELLRAIKSINVRSFEFAQDHMYSEADLRAVRAQLQAPGWSPLAQVHQRESSSADVDVFVSMDREKINGVAILVSGPRRFTVVNVVGSIDPASLAKLRGHLGLPSLPMM